MKAAGTGSVGRGRGKAEDRGAVPAKRLLSAVLCCAVLYVVWAVCGLLWAVLDRIH